MVNIYDIMDAKNLVEMTKGGYVRVQTHPVYPFNIACYTKQAMFERAWNHVTMNCRGLIYHQETGEILARPFKKFFNYGEPNAATFGPEDWVTVYDKVDGSLGIAYDTPEGPAIATKGSFTSEQAIKGTELLRELYPGYMHDDVSTDLFEIIYPENRIVLDYKNLEGLMYLGSVNIEDGYNYWNGLLMDYWGIPKNHWMLQGEWAEVLPMIDLNRSNAEGVVIYNHDTGDRLKLKQQDYIELHRVMTGLNEKQIWEWFKDKDLEEVLVDLPEELHGWTSEVWNRIAAKFDRMSLDVIHAYYESRHLDRKQFALFNAGKPAWMRGALFAQYDNDTERAAEIIWKQVKP